MRPIDDSSYDASAAGGLPGILRNSTFLAAFLSFAVAQLGKVFVSYHMDKKWDWKKAISPGGMPSSHTAFIVGLTVAVAKANGTNSQAFAICLVLSFIVMYDATGVRFQAGKHAALLHHIVTQLPDDHPASQNYERLKDVLGHTPQEVGGGALVGCLIGYCVQAAWMAHHAVPLV